MLGHRSLRGSSWSSKLWYWLLSKELPRPGLSKNWYPRQALDMIEYILQTWMANLTEMATIRMGMCVNSNLRAWNKAIEEQEVALASPKRGVCRAWWPISALRRLRQEHLEIEASLGTITGSCLKNKHTEIEKKSGSAILVSLTENSPILFFRCEKSQSTQGLPAILPGWVVGQILCLS